MLEMAAAGDRHPRRGLHPIETETTVTITVTPDMIDRVRPGTVKLRRATHPLGQMPEVLQLVTGRSRFVALPRKLAGKTVAEPIAICDCNGLLAAVRQDWRHADACLACWNDPEDAAQCTARHYACTQPEPRECQHGCGAPAALSDRCAWDGAATSCCNCCWDLGARPGLDGVSHKRR